MGTGREATGWPIQGAEDSLGWSGQGGRWARMCQVRARKGFRMARSPAPLPLAVPKGSSPAPTPSLRRPGIPPGRRLQSKRPPSEATRQAPRSRCSQLPPVSVSSLDHRQLPCAGDQEPRLLPRTSFHFSGLCRTGRVPEATALPVPARLHRGFTACLRGGPEMCPRWRRWGLYLVILVGGHRDEGSLWEHMGAEGRVFGAKSVVLVGLHDVQPWLVLVHGVEDDLEEKGLLSAPGLHPLVFSLVQPAWGWLSFS